MRLNRPVVLACAVLSIGLPAIAAVGGISTQATGTIGEREVEKRSGGSVYGFAYRDINRRGWVTDGYFCP